MTTENILVLFMVALEGRKGAVKLDYRGNKKKEYGAIKGGEEGVSASLGKFDPFCNLCREI